MSGSHANHTVVGGDSRLNWGSTILIKFNDGFSVLLGLYIESHTCDCYLSVRVPTVDSIQEIIELVNDTSPERVSEINVISAQVVDIVYKNSAVVTAVVEKNSKSNSLEVVIYRTALTESLEIPNLVEQLLSCVEDEIAELRILS